MIGFLIIACVTLSTFVAGYLVGAMSNANWQAAIDLSMRTQKDLKETARLVRELEKENDRLRQTLNKKFSESDEIKNLLKD